MSNKDKIRSALEAALIDALGGAEVDAATMSVARAYLKDQEPLKDPKGKPLSPQAQIIADAFSAHSKLPFGAAKQ